MRGRGAPQVSLSVSLSLFVSLLLAFVRCFAAAIDALRLVVCWNHVGGVAVWWVSPRESLDSSLHMALAPRRRRGDFVASARALKASSFVLSSAGLFHAGGLVGGNCVSGTPRNSWAAHPSLPKWSIVIGIERVAEF